MNAKEIECIYENTIFISDESCFKKEIEINFDPDYNYAFLAKCLKGNIKIKDIRILLSQVYDLNKENIFSEATIERIN